MPALDLIPIAETPDDFLPLAPRSLTASFVTFQRDEQCWEKCKPYLRSIAGAEPPIDTPKWDEINLWILVKQTADEKGYGTIAALPLSKIPGPFKRALKQNSGTPFYALVDQGRQLRLAFNPAE